MHAMPRWTQIRSFLLFTGFMVSIDSSLAAMPPAIFGGQVVPRQPRHALRPLRACPAGGRALATLPLWEPKSPQLAFLDETREAIGAYLQENWQRAKAVRLCPPFSHERILAHGTILLMRVAHRRGSRECGRTGERSARLIGGRKMVR